MAITKWKTSVEYIDIDSGEILAQIDLNEYKIINKEKNFKIGDKYNETRISYYCKHNGQGNLFGKQ